MQTPWFVKVIGRTVFRSSIDIPLRRIELECTHPFRPGWYRVDSYSYSRNNNPRSGVYLVTALTEVISPLQEEIMKEGESVLARTQQLVDDGHTSLAKRIAGDAVYRWQGKLNLEPEIPTNAEVEAVSRFATQLLSLIRGRSRTVEEA